MKIFVNGKKREIAQPKVSDNFAENELVLIAGVTVEREYLLHENENITVVSKSDVPTPQIIQLLLEERHGKRVQEKISKAKVSICGLGGLGSHIATMLCRLGVGKMVLIDFDTVDLTNLNRQNYFLQDVGKSKTEALANQLKNINPFVELSLHNEKMTPSNCVSLIEDCDFVVEAFDKAETKAMLVNTILEKTDKTVVASNGMAGYGSSNDIETKKIGKRLYLAGDMKTDIEFGKGLMAPRVVLCASHQANIILRLIIGIKEI